MSAAKKKLSPSYAWVILIVVWLCAFTMPANMTKVSALMAPLMEWFSIDEGAASLMMSLFYVMGCVVAFPAVGIINKFGIRKTILVSAACAIVGGLLGVFSGTNLTMFMVSRVIEGVGWGIVAVTGVPAISSWFAPSKRGLPMGIWGIWVAVAFIVGPIVFAAVSEATGTWQSVWWVNIVFDLVIAVLFAILYRDPVYVFDENENPVYTEEAELAKEDASFKWGPALKSPAVWLCAIAQFLICAGSMGIENFLATYVFTNLDASLTMANVIVSLGGIAGIIWSLILGKVSEFVKNNKIILIVCAIAGCIYSWMAFEATDLTVYILIAILIGLAEGGGPAMVFGILAKECPEESLPTGTALLTFLQNLGMIIGTTVVGNAVASVGWATGAHIISVPAYALIVVVTIVLWKKVKS